MTFKSRKFSDERTVRRRRICKINCKWIFVFVKYSFTVSTKCRFNGNGLRNRPRRMCKIHVFTYIRAHIQVLYPHGLTYTARTSLVRGATCIHRNAVHRDFSSRNREKNCMRVSHLYVRIASALIYI